MLNTDPTGIIPNFVSRNLFSDLFKTCKVWIAGFSFDKISGILSTLLSFETICDSIPTSNKDDLIPFRVAFSSMALYLFEAGDINAISGIDDLNDFPLLCGTDQEQGFECILLFLVF